jgi:hypothetical protein
MNANRTFEQTEMTKVVLKALKNLTKPYRDYSVQDMYDAEKLFQKIEAEKLDIRLVSREY